MVMNGLSVIHERSKYIIYADDATLLHHVPPGQIDETQSEINNLISWSSSMKLTINRQKTKMMILSRNKLANNITPIIIDNEPI